MFISKFEIWISMTRQILVLHLGIIFITHGYLLVLALSNGANTKLELSKRVIWSDPARPTTG